MSAIPVLLSQRNVPGSLFPTGKKLIESSATAIEGKSFASKRASRRPRDKTLCCAFSQRTNPRTDLLLPRRFLIRSHAISPLIRSRSTKCGIPKCEAMIRSSSAKETNIGNLVSHFANAPRKNASHRCDAGAGEPDAKVTGYGGKSHGVGTEWNSALCERVRGLRADSEGKRLFGTSAIYKPRLFETRPAFGNGIYFSPLFLPSEEKTTIYLTLSIRSARRNASFVLLSFLLILLLVILLFISRHISSYYDPEFAPFLSRVTGQYNNNTIRRRKTRHRSR